MLGFICFPRIGLGWAAWFALMPLIFLIREREGINTAFFGGLLAGALQAFALLIWIPGVLTQFGSIAAPLAWFLFILLALFLGVYPGLACALTAYCVSHAGRRWLFVFPFAWVAVEYLRTFSPFGGFPWLLLGYSQTDWPRVIQCADLTGVYGVSFIIAGLNTGLAWLWISRSRLIQRVCPLAISVVALCGCLFYGEVSLRRWNNVPMDFKAAILQGDIDLEEPNSITNWKFKDGYRRMADGLGPGYADLLLLPESPSPFSYQYDADYRETMQNLARRFSLGLVLNNVRYRETASAQGYLNTAYFVDGRGMDIGYYDKIHLVPFGEYIPWRRLFFFAETISKDVSDFQAGSEYATFSLGSHSSNAIICFEAIFPGLVRRFVHNGSQLIINLTNDRWYGDSAAPFQHLAMARWRALENRRFMLRAANSGISAVINPTGEVQAQTEILKKAVCVGSFSFLSEASFYARHGDVFAVACAIMMLLFILLASMPIRTRF
jgi:apolipoprotein N-acyltransferase